VKTDSQALQQQMPFYFLANPVAQDIGVRMAAAASSLSYTYLQV